MFGAPPAWKKHLARSGSFITSAYASENERTNYKTITEHVKTCYALAGASKERYLYLAAACAPNDHPQKKMMGPPPVDYGKVRFRREKRKRVKRSGGLKRSESGESS